MATILLSVALVVILFAVMAIGIMFGRQPIKGSCGGMSALGMKEDCVICGGDRNKCDDASRKPAPASGAGDVRQFDPRQGKR